MGKDTVKRRTETSVCDACWRFVSLIGRGEPRRRNLPILLIRHHLILSPTPARATHSPFLPHSSSVQVPRFTRMEDGADRSASAPGAMFGRAVGGRRRRLAAGEDWVMSDGRARQPRARRPTSEEPYGCRCY
jgi:hypothetical protein